MKRTTITSIIILLSILANRAAFTEEQQVESPKTEISNVSEAESKKVIASETFLFDYTQPENTLNNPEEAFSDLSKTGDESSNLDIGIKKDDDKGKAKSPKKDKEAKPEDTWLEKSTGRQLNGLKTSLEELQKVYNTNYRAFRIADAINSFEKNESDIKRNNSLLLDITKQQTFSIYASSYIFPELLKVNTEKMNLFLLSIEKTLTDEIKDTPEEVDKLIKQISESLNTYITINEAYRGLVSKAEENLDKLETINSKTNNLSKLGFYIKKTNKDIIKLIKNQIDSMLTLSEQLTLAIEYSKEQLNFINTHNQSIPVKGKYIAEIRSSFKDFEKFLESYETKQEYNFHLLSTANTQRFTELEKLIGKEEIREGFIKKHIKTSLYFPESKKISTFIAKEDLDKIFELLEITEIDKELYGKMLPYISGESWFCRYEEEKSEKNKKESEEKAFDRSKMPKLIDFEEE
ncbi:MAG: hypothetical protein J6Z11_01605 [Candidatus Riflebacteria bacterium]|nr:hypothetical protein [Candidatus Riflebacteria bacterium]